MEFEITSPSFELRMATPYESVAVARPVGTILCLGCADTVAVFAATYFAAYVRETFVGGHPTPTWVLALTFTLFTICSFIAARLYPGVCENPVEELRRMIVGINLAFLCLAAATFASHDFSQSRMIVMLACGFSLPLVPLCRGFVRATFATRSWWGCPVVILGMGGTGQRVLKTLSDHPRFGLKPVAVLDDDPSTYGTVNSRLIAGPLSSCFEITRHHRISYGIVCMPGLSREQLVKLLQCYGQCFSHVMVIPDLSGMTSLVLNIREVGGIVGFEITHRLLRPSTQIAKRIMDIAIALAAAVVAAPVVAVAALLIRLESPGPVFYWSERVGTRGQTFGVWKLRSMMTNGDEVLRCYLESRPEEKSHWDRTQKLKLDPRVTRIGAIIRKTSIDELPQLWNVLRGEMSIVGPRPMLQNQIEMYGPTFELYKRVRPGITGLWQISGRNQLDFRERVRLDAYLIQNWSVWLDVYIIARTVMAVLRAKGAY